MYAKGGKRLGEEFLLDIIALLNQQLSKKKIKEQLKGMDNSMFVKVISKLSIGLSQRQLKKDLKQLNDLYLQVGADLKIDSALKKKLQGRIKTLQDSISDLQIGVHTKDSDIARSVTEARNKGQRVANRTSIDFNIEVKKEKAIADLEYMAKKYSKLFSNASASAKYNNILDAAYGITDAKQLSNVRAQIAAFTSELKANNLASQSLGDKWKRLIDRAKDLFSAASAVTLIFSQVKQAVSSFLQLDTAMTNLYKVQDRITSRDQFSGLLTKWNKLAQNLAVTTESLISSMEAWSKIGFDLDMSEQLAEITSIFEKTAEISNEKATSTLISAAQAFTEIDDLGVDDYVKRVEAVGDKINAIGNKYAIDSEGIADGLQNASAALKVAGNDLNETIALITATNKIYQNPDEGSNMLKVASMRLRGQVDALKEMGEDAEGVSTDLTKIQQQVYELTGNKVNIFEDDENLKSTYQMILEIGEVFDSLNDRSQADLLEVMFGKQRASAGASLLLNYEELEKIKNDSMNAVNSMAEEYSKYMESASASLTIFKEKLVETYSTFMSGDLIKYTADIGSGLLDLVNATDLLRHGLVGIVSLNIGKGITSIGASVAATVKQMNTLGNALQQVKSLPVDSTRIDVLEQIGKSTKSLTEKNLKLLLSQKQLEEQDKITILTKHKLTEEEAKLKLEKMGLLSVTKTQTAANVAEAATTGTLKNAMLSLKTVAGNVGATIKGMFASNPIGMWFMVISTGVSMLSTAISKTNEKLEESRRANIESATTASENADKLKDLYNEYTRLASIQDRTTSEEEAFKTAVENITVALGDKAEILKDLTADTDEYTNALARATKEELQSQAVTATIGRKASQEELQDKIWDKWGGSQVTIDSNDKGQSLSDEAQKAVDIVSESLKEFETVNRTWKNISWDISSDDPTQALEYYNSLIEAREKLVLASENDESLLDTEIYEDLNTAINSMSESLDTYIEKLYEEEKLNYMAQNGIPSVTEEYKAMETALVSAAGTSVDLQNRFKELLTSDFSDLATDVGNVGNAVSDASTQAQSAIPLFNQLTGSEEELDKFQSSVKSATEAYSTLLSGNYTSTELLDSIQAINKAVSDMGGSLNWEFINKQKDSLDLLGDAIQLISKKYTESILSGMGIDIHSEFGQMLANMITQAFEAEAAFEGMNSQLDNLQSSYQTLTDVLESYNKTGYISLDSLQSLLTADENLIAMLEVENGQLAINQAAYENLVTAQLMEFKAKLNDAAAAEIEALAKQKAEQATNQNADASNNAVEKLDAETAAFNRNTSAAISNAVAKAEESGVSEEEINGILDKYNEVWNAAVNNFSGDFDGFMGGKSGAGKAGKKAGDAYVDAFEKELKKLQTLRDQGKITEKQYLDYLRKLYQRFFRDKKKYAEQYAKYEHEYLQGMKSLYESALSGITSMLDKQISAYEDSKSAAVESLEAQRDAAIEAKEAEKERYEQEIELINKQIAAKEKAIQKIRDEIEAMETANADRKMALNLQLDEYNLQRQLNQKTKRIYTEDGFKYDIDTSGLKEARQKVEDDKLEIEISKKEKEIKLVEKEIDLLNEKKDGINENIDLLDKQIDQINEYYDKLIADTEKYWDNLIKGLQDYKSRWEELGEIEENAKLISTLKQLGIEVDDVLGMSEEAFSKFKDEYVGILADIYSGNDSMLSALSDTTGKSVDQMGSYLDSTQGYIDSLSGIGDSLDPLAESIGNVEESMGTLSTTASDADENLSNAAGSVDSVNSSLSETATTTDTVATNVGTVVDGLNQLPENGKVSGLAGEFETLATKIGEVAKALGIGEGEAVSTLFQAMNSLNDVTLGNEGEGIIGQFTLLKNAITDVIETIGSTEAQTVGSLMSAIAQLNSISLDESIITQFNNLKTAIDSVTAAISGGGGESSEGSSSGGTSSSKGSKQGGVGGKGSEGKGESGGGGNSLTGAIESMGETAKEVIGEPDAEGDGTVIGEFGSMETAVNEVRDAIGTEGSEGEGGGSGSGGKGESDDTLVGSIEYLGNKTEEEMGESDGDGILGKFNEFKGVIEEAANQVKSISEGLDEIDGKEVECSITVNVKMNGSIPAFASGTVLGNMQIESATYNAKYGKAFASGTIGLKHDEKNALRSEYGQPELTVYPNGTTELTTSPVMSDLPKGTVIYNEEETKKIMDNKSNPVGNAHADGTDDSIWTTLADGTKVRDLQPGDEGYWMIEAGEKFIQMWKDSGEEFISNAVFEGQKQLEKWTNEITNNSAISSVVNNNRNQPVTVNQNVTLNCPNLTNNSGVEYVQKQLGNLSLRARQEPLHDY